ALARPPRDFRQYVGLAEDQDLVGAELDLGAPVLAEDDLVALFDVERDVLAVLVPCTRPDGEDAAPLGLLLRGIGENDAARRRLLFLENIDDQAVTKRLQIHAVLLTSLDVAASPDRLARCPQAWGVS